MLQNYRRFAVNGLAAVQLKSALYLRARLCSQVIYGQMHSYIVYIHYGRCRATIFVNAD